MTHNEEAALSFAERMTDLGFQVWLIKPRPGWEANHGFVSNGIRVFEFHFSGAWSLSGTYGPPSIESGTSWGMAASPWDLHTVHDVEKVLEEVPPCWTGRGWKYVHTLESYLANLYAADSYEKFQKEKP